MKYHVYNHDFDFGIFEAATTQEARDRAAQQAGYKHEGDMIMNSGYAELVAVRTNWEVEDKMTGNALAGKDTAPTTGTTPEHDRNSSAKALIREMAMDIGKEAAAYIEVMYPDAVTAASSTFLLSVRNCIHNEIIAAIQFSDEGKIVARLAERKIFRRKWKAMSKKNRDNSGKRYTAEETEQAIQALIAETNQPENI